MIHYILYAKHQAYDKIEIEEMEMLQQDKREYSKKHKNNYNT